MRFWTVILAFLLLNLAAEAQIVNVEKKRSAKSGFNANFKFSFNLKETGSLLTQLNNTIDLQYHKNAYGFILLNDLSLLRFDGGDIINDGFQHLRYNYTVRDSSFLTLEMFIQHQYNEQKILKRRIIGGGGPRFRIVSRDRFIWYIAPLVMYEHEELSDDAGTTTGIIRGDAYTNFYVSLNDMVSINHISYYQPKLEDFEDYRYSGETGLRFKITDHFAFSSSFAMDFDSDPPAEVAGLFYYFKNQIVIIF